MVLGHSQEFDLTDAEFRMFCELMKRRCGLHFDERSRYLVEKRIGRRIRENDLDSFSSYHFLLRNGRQGEEEFARLVDELTTNETYFFREIGQLRTLIDEIIPALKMARRQAGRETPVTIWSAGCSSGEEPYSIVMLAMEAGYEPGRDLRVYASDISKTMLARSRRGVYRETSFRETDPLLRSRYFEQKDEGSRLTDSIRRSVDFIHINLMDRDKIALLGSMDVVICRNVIIYFDLETKKRVIQTFYEKLRPGGYLLLGHSESLVKISNAFELKHMENDLVYRRPVPGEERGDSWHDLARRTLAEIDAGGSHDPA